MQQNVVYTRCFGRPLLYQTDTKSAKCSMFLPPVHTLDPHYLLIPTPRAPCVGQRPASPTADPAQHGPPAARPPEDSALQASLEHRDPSSSTSGATSDAGGEPEHLLEIGSRRPRVGNRRDSEPGPCCSQSWANHQPARARAVTIGHVSRIRCCGRGRCCGCNQRLEASPATDAASTSPG
jgi:hypothetical protein